MDLSHIENAMKDSDSGMVEKKETLNSNINNTDHDNQGIDSGTALQLFLDHIPHQLNSWHQKLTWYAIKSYNLFPVPLYEIYAKTYANFNVFFFFFFFILL